ncbi:hypothetical protein Tco_0032997 [Tanacetum coccineum]
MGSDANCKNHENYVLEAHVKELVGYQGLSMSPQSSLLPQVNELWGSEQECEYSEEDQSEKEEIDWIDSEEDDEKKDDTDGDKSIDLEMTDDEETDDEVLQGKEQVNDDEDEEMTNAEVEESGKSDEEEDTDAAMADAEKTKKQRDTTDAEISSLLDIKIQSEVPHIQSLSVLKVHVSVISKPLVLTPVQETPSAAHVTTLPPPSVTTIPPAPLQQSTSPIPSRPITTDAPTIITAVHESDALSIRHTADLIQKYSVKPVPESSKIQTPTINLEQEYEKSASKILKIKKEQVEKQKMPKYTIKSTDKATLKEYDQKSALYQTIHENKSFNRNPANHRLYHDLIEALIEDEYVMDKGVADTGKKTKRRRTKESKSSKKPSTTKETPKGKAPSKGSKTGKSASAKELVEEPIVEVVMDDADEEVVRNDDQPQDTSEPKTAKTPNPEWFKQPPRPLTPDPEWNKHQGILGQPEQPWFNQMVSATKDPLTFNDLIANPIDFSKYVLNRLKIDNLTQDLLLGPAYNLLKATCSSSIELEYNFQECFNALTGKLVWNNP